MNITNFKVKELVFFPPKIISFHGCPTILNALALEFVIFILLGMCGFLAEDFFFLNFV